MKKRIFCLVLALCAALALSAAFAEESAQAYVPGEVTRSLLADAFRSGQIITGDLNLVFKPNAAMLTSSDEEKELLDAVEEIVNSATISLGAGRIDGGVRIELGGVYQNAGANRAATADAALNLTTRGVSLESSLIQGEKITATWQTLLRLCGADESIVALLDALQQGQIDMSELSAAAASSFEEAALLLLPYGETIYAFIDELPFELKENLPASNGYPAAAQEAKVTCTEKQIAELIVLLTNQLENDETLAPMIDQWLAQIAGAYSDVSEASDFPTTASLCAAIREAAVSQLTDEDRPYTLFIALDESGAPLYITFQHDEADGSYEFANMLFDLSAPSGITIRAEAFSADADDNLNNGFGISAAYTSLSQNPYDYNMDISYYTVQNGTTARTDCVLSSEAFTTDDQLPGCKSTGNMNLSDTDGNLIAVYTFEDEQALTPDGGERSDGSINADIYSGGQSMAFNAQFRQSVAPSADGLTGTASVIYDMSELGIDEIGLTIGLRTGSYDPAASAALKETALETVSTEEMNALAERAYAAVISKALEVSSLLPQKIMLMLGE